MRKILFSVVFACLSLVGNMGITRAQTVFTAASLTPEYKAIIEKVKVNCNLTDVQSQRFTTDYITLVNAFNANAVKFAGNKGQMDIANNGALLNAGTKFRTYLNNAQFTKLTNMIKAGQLMPPNSSTVTVPVTVTPPTTGTQTATVPTPPVAQSTTSNVTQLFREVSGFMKVSEPVSQAVIPILTEFDTKATAIKTANVNNPAATKNGMDALGKEYLVKLKAAGLTDEQLKQLLGAIVLQENILSGKNLSPQQQQLLNEIRTKYNLNDAQTMTVVLVLVEGKLRGDAIKKTAQSNKQLAQQQTVQLMADLDNKLKTGLTPAQYTAIKSDMEKLLKGGK